MQEDLNLFFDDFADEVRAENPSRTFCALFDNAFFSAELGEMVLESTQPRLLCRGEHTAGFSRETVCHVRGTPYEVERVEPDGTGLASVILVAACN